MFAITPNTLSNFMISLSKYVILLSLALISVSIFLIIFFFIFSPLILIILNIDLTYLLKINTLLALSLLSIIFIASMTASITMSKNNRLSLTSILTLPLFVPILIFSMAITDLIDFNTGRMYLFFVAYFLLNLAFSPLLTSFALKKLSV